MGFICLQGVMGGLTSVLYYVNETRQDHLLIKQNFLEIISEHISQL